jgi:hypothetical protein
MLALVSDGLETLAEDTGKKPVIKAFCWMQGETDAGNTSYRNNYFLNTKNLVSDLRDEWQEDSKEGGFYDTVNNKYYFSETSTPLVYSEL